MDIRTKLVFALVAVALGSMLALGVVMTVRAGTALQQSREQQLEGLAESKMEGVEQVLAGWRDRVRLIASRTQMRLSLREYRSTGSEEARARMGRILLDALEAAAGVESLEIRDPDGRTVVSVSRSNGIDTGGSRPSAPGASGDDDSGAEVSGSGRTEPIRAGGAERAAAPGVPPPPSTDEVQRLDDLEVPYEGLTFHDGTVGVGFRADLVLDGETLGALHLRLVPRELYDLAAVRTGLGETGETLIVLQGADGAARVIRGSPEGAPRLSDPMDPMQAPDPVRLGLEGVPGPVTEGVTDAGGDSVWASVRPLELPGWGLVMKLDADEGRRPVEELRRELMGVALSLAAFAILAGTFLGFRFAQPILDLSAVADRIREGELDARATVETQDEVGLLARTFNQMADELEERMTELREFHTFFEVSLDLLCIAATDGYFKTVNPAFERTLGWTPETLLSRPIVEFVHPNDRDATVREIEKLADGVPTISFENWFRHADGSYRRLRWTSYPEPDTGLLYAVARDVTESRTDAPPPRRDAGVGVDDPEDGEHPDPSRHGPRAP